jgi:hypothetical protein
MGQAAGAPAGAWTSTADGDQVAVASIAHDDRGWTLQVVSRCGEKLCPWPRLPLMMSGRAAGPAGAWRGLAIRRDADSITHVAVRLEHNALVMERYDLSATPPSYDRATLTRASMVPVTVDLDRVSAIELAATAGFLREFGETIDRPAIRRDACATPARVTATAHLPLVDGRSNSMVLRLSDEGVVLRKSSQMVVTPHGRIRVLAVLVRHPETVASDGEAHWRKGVARINEEHAGYASARGYRAPLVVFETTTIVLEPWEVRDPRARQEVRMAVKGRGIGRDAYDVLMIIDLNPQNVAGGQAFVRDREIYVGNYGRWTAPIGEGLWRMVAATAFHHEMAHLWGWEHDWSSCERVPPFRPFITDPVLLGWEDTDGDGLPEIDDPSPYGRTAGRW